MSKQTIFRTKKENNYTVLSNHHINNVKLSWKARGLLTYILSKPDNWKFYVKHLTTQAKDGRDATQTGLRELIKAGYIVKNEIRATGGKFSGVEYIVHEQPKTDFPLTANPFTENPSLPSTESKQILKTATQKTDTKVKQEGQSTECTVAGGKTKKPVPKKFNFADFCRQEAVGLQGRLFPAGLRWTDNQVGFLKYSLSNGYGGICDECSTIDYINNKAALATARSTKPGGWFRYFQRAVEENWSPEFTVDGETRPGPDYSGRQVRYQGAEYVLSELGTLTLGSGVVTAGDVAAAIASGALEVLN